MNGIKTAEKQADLFHLNFAEPSNDSGFLFFYY